MTTSERRRLNIAHKHGGRITDIVAIGHDTYKRRAYWFFKAKCEWNDGSHERDPEHLYEIAPQNLAYEENDPASKEDVRVACEAMNAYLVAHGRFDRTGNWIPYYEKEEVEVML